MAEFVVTKKFKVPVKVLKLGCRVVDTSAIESFWKACDHVPEKRGCYVFSMKAAKGEKPFYVGKASKQPFRDECFTPHKLAEHYNIILGSRKGTPYLRFVVQQKSKGKWSLKAIDDLEEFLIARAAARNRDLSNKRRLPNQSWSIRGVASGGKGKPSTEAQAFRRLLGIK